MDEKDKRASTAATRATKPLNPKTVKTHPAQEGDKEGVKSKSESVLLEEAKSELQKLAEQSAANLDGWQRERAEFSNYKRRIERESQLLHEYLTGEIIKKYLVVLDDMERAVKTRPTEGAGAAWAEGVELILRKLQGILEAEGVTRIPAESELFDPNRHEAITHEPSPDHESGAIIEVLQQGYMLGDRVIRPARVRVAQ